MFFGDFNFDILLTVLDVFHFLCFIFFWGGLPHRKGVCILVFLIFFNALIVTLIQSGG